MFDDPKRELNRLQRELLAEEEQDDDLADILAMLEEAEPEAAYEEDFVPEPLHRNYANGYGGKIRNYANDYGRSMTRDLRPEEEEPDYEEYWEDDDRMVCTDDGDGDDRAVYRDYGRKKPKEKGIRGLVMLACLELLAIIGILGWWMLWLM